MARSTAKDDKGRTTTRVRAPGDVAREIFDAVGAKDLDRALGLVAEDAVDDFVAIGEYRGRSEIRRFFAELFAAFPDFEIRVLRIVADNTAAVVQWQAHGTFSGGVFQGIEPTGRHVVQRGVDVMEIEGGQVQHNTIYYDGMSMARQIGMLPKAESPGERAMQTIFNAKTRLVRRTAPAK